MSPAQQSVLTEYTAILAFLDAKAAKWKTLTPLVKSVFFLRTYINLIMQQTYRQHNQLASMYTPDKNGHMLAMSDRALALLLKIRSYAKAGNDKGLLYAINYSEKELRSGSELQIVKRCQTIYNKAKEHLTALEVFGVTTEELLQLTEAITAVKPLITQRNAIASKHIATTANLALLFEEARAEAENLDNYVKSLIYDKRFIKDYRQIRQHAAGSIAIDTYRKEGVLAR